MNRVNFKANKIRPLENHDTQSNHQEQHRDIKAAIAENHCNEISHYSPTKISVVQGSVKTDFGSNDEFKQLPSSEPVAFAVNDESKSRLTVLRTCSSKDIIHRKCLLHEVEASVKSADDIWVQNRFIVRSIFAVCFFSSLAIFCVLVYDIVSDAIKAEEHKSIESCMKGMSAVVDLFYDVLRLYEITIFNNSSVRGSEDLNAVEESRKSTQELAELCQTISHSDFVPSCDYLLTNASIPADMAIISVSVMHISTLSSRVRDQFLTCISETDDQPWMLTSVYLALVELLRYISQEAVLCCVRSSTGTPSVVEYAHRHRAILNHIGDLLNFPLNEKNLRTFSSGRWNITDTLTAYDELTRCTNESELSDAYRHTLATLTHVRATLDDLRAVLGARNLDMLSYHTRRIVFSCIAIVTVIGTAGTVCIRVKKMADCVIR